MAKDYEVIANATKMTRPEWLELRRNYIGGSDCGAILGVNKYKGKYQLYLEKTGQIDVFDEDSESAAYFGRLLEPIVLNEFSKRTGKKVRNKNLVLRSKKYPWMIANLDSITYSSETGEMEIVEAKTCSEYKRDEWENGVGNQSYLAQILHYCICVGARRAHIACICGGNKFYYHTVKINDYKEMCEQIIEAEKEFYECCRNKSEPAIDGLEATTALLNGMYSEAKDSTIILPSDTRDVFEEYAEASKLVQEADERKTAAANKLRGLLGNNTAGTCGEHKVTWMSMNRTSFDQKKFAEIEPELYRRYLKQNSFRRLVVA